MGASPLTVAIIAAALFAIVIVADVNMNRTFTVDVETPAGWKEVGRTMPYRDMYPGAAADVEANRSDNITFRLRADNGYPWALDETYRVYVNGIEAASGDITAAARSEGTAEFTVSASRLMGQFGPEKPIGQDVYYVGFEVRVGSEMMFANLALREVSAS